MGADKPPLGQLVEGLDRGACRSGCAGSFAELRCALIEGVDDSVGGGARIEKANGQRLPVEGIAVQIEWIPELALDAPEPIGCAIPHLAFFEGMLPVERAARGEVREFDLAGIGGADSGVLGEAEPDIK